MYIVPVSFPRGKRQKHVKIAMIPKRGIIQKEKKGRSHSTVFSPCLLYTSDAADDHLSVDLGGRRIIKKKKKRT